MRALSCRREFTIITELIRHTLLAGNDHVGIISGIERHGVARGDSPATVQRQERVKVGRGTRSSGAPAAPGQGTDALPAGRAPRPGSVGS